MGPAPRDRGRTPRCRRGPAQRRPRRARGRRARRAVPSCAGGYQYERPTASREDRCYIAAPMHALFERFRTRIVPAALTAIGVALLAGGLLTYTNPVTADPLPSADASATPTPTPVAVTSTPSPLITLPPLGSAPPASADPSVPSDRVPTRVRIAALKIDLPIIRQPDITY